MQCILDGHGLKQKRLEHKLLNDIVYSFTILTSCLQVNILIVNIYLKPIFKAWGDKILN